MNKNSNSLKRVQKFIEESCNISSRKIAFKHINRKLFDAENYIIHLHLDKREENITYLMAYLYANELGDFNSGLTIGQSFNNLVNLNKSNVEYFWRICRCDDREDLIHEIMIMSNRFKKNNLKINLTKLYNNVYYWGNRVTREWKRDFPKALDHV